MLLLSTMLYGKTINDIIKKEYIAEKNITIKDKFIFFNTSDKKKLKENSFSGEIPGYKGVYIIYSNNEIKAYIYVEKLIFRGSSSIFMIIIKPDGSIKKILPLRNYGLSDYHAPQSWLNSFIGFSHKKLKLFDSIDTISRATITDSIIRRYLKNLLLIQQIIIKKTK